MINFSSFVQLKEAGAVMNDSYGYCPNCSKNSGYRPQKLNPWQTKVERCRLCGEPLFAKGDVKDNIVDSLKDEIASLEKNPDVMKGQAILDALNADNAVPIDVYMKFGVDEPTADKLIEKAVLLGVKKRKLEKLLSN